jgi:LPXTG-site transpeptidase (sortase) family protein
VPVFKRFKLGKNSFFAFLIIFFLCLGQLASQGGIVQAAPLQQGLSFPAQINKSFDPINVVAGQVSRLSVTIYNPNTFQLTDAAWTDDLIHIQPGISISNPVNLSNGCNGGVTAIAGQTSFSLSGGIVDPQVGPTPGECTVSIDVVSTTPGNQINTLEIGALSASGGGGEVHNTSPASATLQVSSVQPPSLSKLFNPTTIFVGANSRLTITLRNNDLVTALTKATFTDTLPGNVVLASSVNPVPTGCGGGTITAAPGTKIITLNNGTIAANTTCTVAVNVTSPINGNYPNSIPLSPDAGSLSTQQGVTNSTAAADTLVVQNVGVTKSFSPTSIVAGAVSSMTIRIQNPTSNAYTGVILPDTLPGDLIIAGSGTLTNCGAGVLEYPDGADNTLTPGANERTVRLSGGTVPGTLTPPTSSDCVITLPVTSIPNATASTWTNNIFANTLRTDQGISNPNTVSANLTVTRWLTGTKAFSPASIPAGGTSTVTIALRNNRTNAPLNNVSFTDVMPNNNLLITGTPTLTNCGTGGSISFSNAPLPARVAVSGATIAANTTCNIIYQVTSSVVASSTNTIPAGDITTTEGASNLLISSNSLSVVTSGGPVRVSKAFQTSPIAPGATVRLRITITAPTDIPISGITFTDVLPVGLDIVTSPAPVNGCGGTLSTLITPVGQDEISLAGGVIATANAACNIDVYVSSQTAGSYLNSIGINAINTSQLRTNTAGATSTLVVSGFTMTKAFYPTAVNANGYSTLTITLINSSPLPITNVTLLDDLSTWGGTYPTSGVYIASAPEAITTCAGGVIDYPDGVDGLLGPNPERKIRMTGGTIAAKVGSDDGRCTISVQVQGKGSAQSHDNSIPVANASGIISGTPISPRAAATATLSIGNLTITVNKGFVPRIVTGGSSSTLSVILTNPNSAALAGITFTDTMPAGMTIANPPNLSKGTCNSDSILTGTFGSNSFTFSNGKLAAAASCTFSLSTTTNVNGNLTNTIPALLVTTTNGATNPQPAEATLTNLPGASVSKAFAPNPVIAQAGDYSVLTITIQNTGNVPLSGMGLIDNLPASLKIAGAPAPTPVTHCGGTLTADADTRLIQLFSGSLIGTSSCTLEVSVSGVTPGGAQNCIAINALTNNENVGNKETACDTLTVLAAPAISLAKTANPTTYSTSGAPIVYSYVITNIGGITLAGPFTVSDDKATVTCNAVPVGWLTPNSTLNCSGTYTTTQNDLDNGSVTNTATASGNGLTSNTTTATVTATQNPSLTLTKTATESGYDTAGQTLHFTVTARNSGNVTLTSVVVSDPQLADLNCVPSQPASLAPSASMVCSGTHTVSQADINTGSYRNAASASANPPSGPPLSGAAEVTVNADQNPSLRLTKTAAETNYSAVGNVLHFAVTATNNGNLPLTSVSISDPQLTDLACTPSQPVGLDPGGSLVCMGTHTVSQADLDAGFYKNDAGASSTPPSGPPLTRSTDATVPAVQNASLTLTKVSAETTYNLIGDRLHYTITARNNGNVNLAGVAITDPLLGALICVPAQPAALAPGESLVCTGLHTVVQADLDAGSYRNTAGAVATPPSGDPIRVSDEKIVYMLFDPPLGIKTSNDASNPVIQWTIVWINNQNGVSIHAQASDPIPAGSTFVDDGISSGYPLPAGSVSPTTFNGVTCQTDPGSVTTTTYCYYEGPSLSYSRGRVIWQGDLGPDLGATTRDTASNEIVVTFSVRLNAGINSLNNVASMSIDQNDDNDFSDPGEVGVATAARAWGAGAGAGGGVPGVLPDTGFAPGKIIRIPPQRQESAYLNYENLTLEIPSLKVNTEIVGIPILHAAWDISWLGNRAGWLQGTAFPTWAGNSVVTGHVWNADNTPGIFIDLKKLAWNDQIIVHAWKQKYTYQVRSVQTIKPDAITQVVKHENVPWLTLLTCGDFNEKTGAYKTRELVRAVLVKIEPE